MNEELPPPLTQSECDCTDLDGFMLNVERLMASELVALSSHETVAAALFLWCRAWKQRPAASLPDDDRVNAAFARLPLAKFKRLKSQVLHGFVKCSDGRLYHRVLAGEAANAYQRKLSFQKRRNDDAERLRKWREKRGETRCDAEGQDRESTGQGLHRESDSAPASFAPPDWLPSEPWAGFVEMRKKIRAPLTERALTLAIGELERLRRAGEDPAAVLNQSVFRGWKGLFPVKPDEANHGANGARGGHAAFMAGAALFDAEQGGGSTDDPQPANGACAIAVARRN
jgi:uncharacterized protein YdaU (DUF1376 family)